MGIICKRRKMSRYMRPLEVVKWQDAKMARGGIRWHKMACNVTRGAAEVELKLF